jgi:hypothetical protein
MEVGLPHLADEVAFRIAVFQSVRRHLHIKQDRVLAQHVPRDIQHAPVLEYATARGLCGQPQGGTHDKAVVRVAIIDTGHLDSGDDPGNRPDARSDISGAAIARHPRNECSLPVEPD